MTISCASGELLINSLIIIVIWIAFGAGVYVGFRWKGDR